MADLMSDVVECVEVNLTHSNKLYDIIIWNDDVTPVEFVIVLLIKVFGLDDTSAITLTAEVDQSDKGIVGTYVMDEAYDLYEQAQKFIQAVNEQIPADLPQIPLLITVEEHK